MDLPNIAFKRDNPQQIEPEEGYRTEELRHTVSISLPNIKAYY